LLEDATSGDKAAADALLPLVYDQLRAAAQQQLAAERPGHTLQATAIVHDAYLRLIGPREIPWQNRAHFYAAAAQAIRRILLDHARSRARRGGVPTSLRDIGEIPDVATLSAAEPEQIVAVDDALRRLESEDPDAAALVRLRFYAGLSVDDAAAALNVAPRTAARLWQYARASLYRIMQDSRELP
jgi:RNA polymerase sigma factor (TIGR02999 family)